MHSWKPSELCSSNTGYVEMGQHCDVSMYHNAQYFNTHIDTAKSVSIHWYIAVYWSMNCCLHWINFEIDNLQKIVVRKTFRYSMVIVKDLYLRKSFYCFQLASNDNMLILLSSDALSYCDTFDMMQRYSWSLYRPISKAMWCKMYKIR